MSRVVSTDGLASRQEHHAADHPGNRSLYSDPFQPTLEGQTLDELIQTDDQTGAPGSQETGYHPAKRKKRGGKQIWQVLAHPLRQLRGGFV